MPRPMAAPAMTAPMAGLMGPSPMGMPRMAMGSDVEHGSEINPSMPHDNWENEMLRKPDEQMYQETPRGIANKFQPVVVTRSNLGSREWTEK
jgi:hypothetical protein